jgi:hypothetical protein
MIPPALSTQIVPGVPSGGVPGKPWAPVTGNPGTATTEPDASGTGLGNGRNANQPQWLNETKQPGNNYGGDKPNGHTVAPGVMNPPHTAWRGGADFSNDNTIARDRHVLVRNAQPRVGVQDSTPGNPPNPDSPSQGKPRPLFSFVNRSLNNQQGTDNCANQDDFTRNYARVPNTQASELPGRAFACRLPSRANDQQYGGSQGDGWTPVYGGVPGLYQPYGSYGGYTARDTKGVQSPVEQGAPGDGPHKFFSGPPHGLHSQTYPSYDNTLGRYMAIPQQHAPRVDRPANSNIAGQDYSQTVQPQGQTGTVVPPSPRFTSRSRFGG